MKITKEIWLLGELHRIEEFNSISDAVEDAAFKSTDEVLGRLVEALYDDEVRTKTDAVRHILGPGYEVEE